MTTEVERLVGRYDHAETQRLLGVRLRNEYWSGCQEAKAAEQLAAAADEIARMRAAIVEGARILELDGDEWGVAHLLREALQPNEPVNARAAGTSHVERPVGR